jgi:membrane peptidoglycan carboxypeptidase
VPGGHGADDAARTQAWRSGAGGERGGAGRGGGGRGRGNGGGRNGWDGNGRARRKGDWWRHWSWKKALGVAAGAAGVFIVAVIGLIAMFYSQTPIPTAATASALQQSSVVYFRDGHTVVGSFGTTNRQILAPNQIPTVAKEAVVAAEDKHFYHEGGVSPTGIVRAAISDLTSGSVQQGGSTITQQFVRNYYAGIGTSQTISRKIKEIFVAEKVASQKSKDWILTQYMNTVLLGGNVYGFGAASQAYFGKPIAKLDVAQSAMLAAMIQSPNGYDPTPGTPGYKPLVARWHYVLQAMVNMGNLSAKQAASAKFPKIVPSNASTAWTGYRGYIMQAVLNELENTYHYSLARINNGGLHITTTFSEPLMNSLYASVNAEKHQMKVDGKGLPPYAHIGAVLEQPGTGAIYAMYSGPSFSAKNCSKIKCQWDMALQNREQVGSSFKPYVLSLARSQGMSVKTSTLDGYSPLWIPPVSSPTTFAARSHPASSASWYQVANDAGDGSLGPVNVVQATALSLNTAYTDLYHRVAGTDGMNMVNMAQSFGIDTQASGLNTMRSEVGSALGQASLTVEEQANTFATLANNGQYVTPHVIQQISTQNSTLGAKVQRRTVLQPDQASDVDYALSFDTKAGGTAPTAGLSDGREIIAKTGTTNLSQSAFFIGAIPQFSLAVGMFTNQQGCPGGVTGCNASASLESSPPAGVQTLYGVGGLQGYGGQWPAAIWHNFAQKEFLKLTAKPFPTPVFGGSPWNLLSPNMQPQPKPTPQHTQPQDHNPNPGNDQGNGHHGHNPPPTPPATQTPTATPTATLPGATKPSGGG